MLKNAYDQAWETIHTIEEGLDLVKDDEKKYQIASAFFDAYRDEEMRCYINRSVGDSKYYETIADYLDGVCQNLENNFNERMEYLKNRLTELGK